MLPCDVVSSRRDAVWCGEAVLYHGATKKKYVKGSRRGSGMPRLQECQDLPRRGISWHILSAHLPSQNGPRGFCLCF